MRRPDFFIVGAPKCGTTALYRALRRHPRIFMPDRKEPNFFGSDFTAPYPYFIRDESEYLALFEPAGDALRVGEASAWYMYSRRAAREIVEYSPGARAIVMLRDPVDLMYALHSQRIYSGNEDITDFEEALAAEPDRKRGRRIPPDVNLVDGLFYREVARLSPQVERVFDAFGRDRVHVILLDDLRRNPERTLADVCRFLGVDPDADLTLPRVNQNRRVRMRRIHRIFSEPPGPARAAVRRILPRALREWMGAELWKRNVKTRPRPPLDPALRARLRAEFRDDVLRLGELIGRQLTAWTDIRAGR